MVTTHTQIPIEYIQKKMRTESKLVNTKSQQQTRRAEREETREKIATRQTEKKNEQNANSRSVPFSNYFKPSYF